MTKLYSICIAILLIFSITIVSAAQSTCPVIVQTALTQLENSCESLARNEACYGNGEILAFDAEGDALNEFSTVGDIIDLVSLSNLELSALDEQLNVWGLAVLSIQANIPNTLPGQNVTMLIFGESTLQSTEDASAFFFSSGIGQLACNEAPNGLLIQTPEGVGEINLSINNVSIELGSTAFITAEAEGDFTFALLEGNASLDSGESTITLVGGEFTTILLDEDFNPEGDFAEPQAIEGNLELPQLPITPLPRDISDLMPGGESASSGGRITPQNGTWRVTMGQITAESCPAMLTDAFSSGMMDDQTTFVDFGGEDWDFETFFRNETTENGGGDFIIDGTFTSPELNVYEYRASDPEIPFVFGMEVISETYIEGYYYIDASSAFAGCKITFPYTVQLVE